MKNNGCPRSADGSINPNMEGDSPHTQGNGVLPGTAGLKRLDFSRSGRELTLTRVKK